MFVAVFGPVIAIQGGHPFRAVMRALIVAAVPAAGGIGGLVLAGDLGALAGLLDSWVGKTED